MKELLEAAFERLITALGDMEEITAIGKSGGPALPVAGDSDIDVFLFCDEMPCLEKRRAVLQAMGEEICVDSLGIVEGKYWGLIDFVRLQGVEVCLMYFTVDKTMEDVRSIWEGERLERENNCFYPTGRCASILSMHVLLDRQGFLAGLKESLLVYPAGLARELATHHGCQLRDSEDFERAVARKDVLFYHATLDAAMDHFLQAIFALNHCYFPSRKRSLAYIEGFEKKPADCAQRLLRIVALGGNADTIEQSYDMWTCLREEFLAMLGF